MARAVVHGAGGRLRALLLILFLLAILVESSVDPYQSSFSNQGEDEEEGAGEGEFPPPPPPPPQTGSSHKQNTRSNSWRNDDGEDDDGDDEDRGNLSEDGDYPATGSTNSKLRKSKPQPAPPNSESLVIHLVPHSHVDQGWLKTADAYEETVFEILSSVTQHLDLDAKRKFVWAEIWYFKRWFDTLSNAKRERVKRLVRDGRFEFVSGGLVSVHDEALSSQRLVTEQLAEGHTFLEQTFGIPQPRIAWQIDAFGHSDATPAILSRLGFSVVVLNRVHFRVKQRFRKGQHLEFLWRSPKPWSNDGLRPASSASGGEDDSQQIFAHMLPASYASPEGHDFEKIGARQVTAPRGRATKLLQYAKELSRSFRTHHVMIPWGDDLRFRDAEKQFGNMDKILAEVATENPSVRIQYSTLSEYFEALQRTASSSSLRFPSFAGDFLPYADAGDAYWVGIYSSRAMLKRWARYAENQVFLAGFLFSFARAKSSVLGHVPKISSIELETGRVVVDESKPAPSWGMGLFRSLAFAKRQSALVGAHHHAITGQAKEVVAKDFLRRARASAEAASRVSMESLSVLLAKRRVDSSSTAVYARPPLRAWSQTVDVLELKEDGRQWPLIFANEQASPRKEVVQIRLEVANFALTKRIRVVDHAGAAVVGQVHHVIANGGGKSHDDWRTDVVLVFVVDVPALGFTTYFVSCASNSDRLASSSSQQQQAFIQSVPITVYNIKRGRITASNQQQQQQEGIKISPTLALENTNGGCYSIDNDLITLEMDCDTGLIKAWINKKTKKRTLLKQEFRAHDTARGGSALFRPDRLESSLIQFKSQLTIGLVKGPLVQEVQILADGVSQVVRLVRAPNTPELEAHVLVSTAVAGVNPDTDTVVRYTTDLKTGSQFFTDNASGALRERRGIPDTPLASNFFPCSTGIVIKGEQRNAPASVLGIVFNQPVACTGAAGIAANAGNDFGIIELVLHRNPTADDARGLGEGLNDYGVSRLDSLLFLDQTEAALAQRPALVQRIVGMGDYWMAQMERSALLAPLLNREVWAAKFQVHVSFLHKFPPGNAVRIASIFPRDETSDEILFRVEAVGATEPTVHVDFAQAFPPVDWVVFGAREFRPKALPRLTFQASERADDFTTSSNQGSEDVRSGGVGASFVLSEHAIKEMEVAEEEGGKNKNKKRGGGGAPPAKPQSQQQHLGASSAAFPGGLLESCPIMQVKPFPAASATGVDIKRGTLRVFSVGLLYIPDDRLVNSPGLGEKRKRVVPSPPSQQQQQQRGRHAPALVDEMDDEEEGESSSPLPPAARTGASLQSRGARDHTKGKSLSSLRSELGAEERRSAALELRSQRLQKNVDELLRELDLFQDIDGGLDKKAALEELNRAEEQLAEGNLMLKESRSKAAALQWELNQAESLEDAMGKSTSRRHGAGGNAQGSSYQESSLHGFFAGAGGMLLVVVAFQWFTGRRQKHRQAFVPVGVRYNNPPPNSFAVPTKRL